MNEKIEAMLRETADLVSVPEVYLEVKRIVDDPMSGAADVARTVSSDPALAARFLRIANSAIFARRNEISLISHAVAMLGTQLVRDLVLAASVGDMFKNIDPKVMDVRKFWARSVECGVLAKAIAEHIGVLDNEHVFIEGLLADLGHMLLFVRHGSLMQDLCVRAERDDQPLPQLERAALGFDYCELGGAIARAWDLPPGLVTVIERHQTPATAQQFQLETAIVHLAYRLAASSAEAPPVFDPAALQLTDCDAATALEIRTAAEATIAAATATFNTLDQAA